ncbi:MAG: hypothetical protein H6721_26690 [Sandaracinus sp.]|nr:hypothetical protein [Sandaracinus sp.]MCB9616095.1 hypothetical protein [Sandaracinus sp.]MCB9620438.1 hypothetical protein [Sandaracinus sp.]MCB9635722.1 hypothetical protein [Sandaracinus sp.]
MTTFVDAERTEALLFALRQLAGRGGYTEEDGTAREAIVGAQAYAGSFGSTAVARAAAELFAHAADETLLEWEQLLGLPNDVARSNTQRRERLAAVFAATGGHTYAFERAIAKLTWRVDPTLLTNTSSDADIAERSSIAQTAILLDEDDHVPSAVGDTPHEKLALAEALQRAYPAHALGQLTRGARMEACFASARGARWGANASADGADADIGKVILDADPPQIGLADTLRYPVRDVSFAQLTRLDAEDLLRVERKLGWHASQNDALATTGIDTQGVGGTALWFNFTVGASSTVTVAAESLRDRIATVYAAGGTSGNRQPGDASDADGGDVTTFSDVWYTGGAADDTSYRSNDLSDGVVTYTGSRFAYNTAVGLRFVNAEASPMEVWGVMLFTPELGKRGTTPSPADTDTAIEFLDGSSGSTLAATAWGNAVRAGYFGKASGTTSGGGIDAGGVRRIGITVGIEKPSAGRREVVLDTTEDWRDRMIVVALATSNGDQVRPGITGDEDLNLFTPKLFFSGPGTADPTSGYSADLDGSGNVRMYARNTDGALCVDFASALAEAAYTALWQIMGTEQLGYHSTPVARITSAYGTTNARIEPRQLNFPQDAGLYEQFAQGEFRLADAPDDSEAMPLGPLGDGSPRLPFSFRVRTQSPIAGGGGVRHVRQRLADVVRIFQSVAVPSSPTDPTYLYTVQRDMRDLRDRFARFHLVWSTSDIRPGQASDTAWSSASKYGRFVWTGPISGPTGTYGITIAANLAMGLVSTIGSIQRLALRNTTGSTLYVAMMAEFGPRLGLRDSV